MRNIDYKLLFKIIIGLAIVFGIAFLLDTYIWQGMEESTKGLSGTIKWIGLILVLLWLMGSITKGGWLLKETGFVGYFGFYLLGFGILSMILPSLF